MQCVRAGAVMHYDRVVMLGSGACRIGLGLIGAAFIGQTIYNFSSFEPNDNLFYLGVGFVLTFALLRVLSAMRRPDGAAEGYAAEEYGSVWYSPALAAARWH